MMGSKRFFLNIHFLSSGMLDIFPHHIIVKSQNYQEF